MEGPVAESRSVGVAVEMGRVTLIVRVFLTCMFPPGERQLNFKHSFEFSVSGGDFEVETVKLS